jgi:cytoskeletal protein CcmA (bactofilin family)
MFTRKSADTLPDRNANSAAFSERSPLLPPAILSPNRLSNSIINSNAKKPLPERQQSDGVVLIGKGTRILGDISDCTMIEIQGTLEGTVCADAVVIREGGGFRGTMQTDKAEVHGVLEGTICVHELLDMRASCNVSGDITYGRLAVADGGNISGNLKLKSMVAEDSGDIGNVVTLNEMISK